MDEKVTYKLPDIKDVDKDDAKILAYLKDAESFVKMRNKELIITPSLDQVGNFSVEIALTDVNPNPLTNFYQLGINVVSIRGKRPKISKTLNATIV